MVDSFNEKEGVVFLDRDGVINKDIPGDYVKFWEEFKFLPGVKKAMKLLKEHKLRVIVITNQSVVGRGIISEAKLKEIHKKMVEEIAKTGGSIAAIYYCPHRPDENCNCRKPKIGLFEKAAKDFKINFKKSWMIGDNQKDIEAGEKMGWKTYQISKSKGLLEIVKIILKEIEE